MYLQALLDPFSLYLSIDIALQGYAENEYLCLKRRKIVRLLINLQYTLVHNIELKHTKM